MDQLNLTLMFSGIIAGATPIVLAVLGETITERAGVINLSLDGTILISAMTGFVAAYETKNIVAGYIIAGLTGSIIASIIGIFSIYMGKSQVAVGFVLTFMTKDLAYFLGAPYARLQGIFTPLLPFYPLNKIPVIGTVFFNHAMPVYLSLFMIGFVWFYLYKTPMGLTLRSAGEYPEAAYARGIKVKKIQMLYLVTGGFFVGISGGCFSLFVRTGWGHPQGAEGIGWIVLAIVIFGGWNPVKAALGAYFFSFLQIMGINFQSWFTYIPAQIFYTAPFPIMILVLLFVSLSQKKNVLKASKKIKVLFVFIRFFSYKAPAALGRSVKYE
jgi:simple sugar transport system permease protein